jgi:ABC-type lipopolysaccharide export system ATPase subunit
VLIVEHDLPLLMGLVDRMYAMEAGAVIAEGSPDEIRADERVIASYLGAELAAIERSGSTRLLGAPVRAGEEPA